MPADGRPPKRYANDLWAGFGGVIIILAGLLLFSTLIDLWPAVDRTGDKAAEGKKVVLGWFLYSVSVTKATALLLLSIVMGAIGAYVHAATAFAARIGRRTFETSWGWWYVLRPFTGAALALIIYFALRTGMLTTGTSGQVDPYGVGLVSALAGLFSKKATDKLSNIFGTFGGDPDTPAGPATVTPAPVTPAPVTPAPVTPAPPAR
jgi:hypothetical protein